MAKHRVEKGKITMFDIDFFFKEDFAKALYETNLKAGVDYMEMGYRASKKVFDETKFGKWKFCADNHIREIVGENDSDVK